MTPAFWALWVPLIGLALLLMGVTRVLVDHARSIGQLKADVRKLKEALRDL